MAEEQMAAILQRLVDLEDTRGAEAVAEGVRQQAITVATRARNERVDLESQVRAQVARIEKVNGEDKGKLRRWIRDVATVHQHT